MTGDHDAAPTGAGTSASPTVSMPFDPPARTRRAMLWLGIALLGAMGVLSYAPRGTIAHLVAMAVGVGVGLAVVRIVVRYGGPGTARGSRVFSRGCPRSRPSSPWAGRRGW